MTPAELIAKWRPVELTERSAAQSHFNDLCRLLGHPSPIEADPKGEWFTFERGVTKQRGGKGWADVWKRDFFGWEYKGKHKDLDAAYDQLLKYRENLGNPPLLVVCDMDRILVHTNFTRTVKKVHELPLAGLAEPKNLDILHKVFFDPDKLRPDLTSEAVTIKAAGQLASIATLLRDRYKDPARVARFLDRVIFCLFAEDVGLLPEGLFSRIVETSGQVPDRLAKLIGQLFAAMAEGGDFGADSIRHFNGNLFRDVEVLKLGPHEASIIRDAARLDWGAVDPSIFGTLFERGMDPAKRSQLGAHYTGLADIEALVEPVVLAPLRRKWAEVRRAIDHILPVDGAGPAAEAIQIEARQGIRGILERLPTVRILDPACGSGNFLYVTLQRLKDLEKEVLVYADDRGLGGSEPAVGPWQLFGIEKSPYAFDLAQLTAWIGWLQWRRANGYRDVPEPVLRTLENFQCMDAILDLSDPDQPAEPAWPEVDFIVGNPPFLGGKKMRGELGDDYVDALFKLWRERVRPEADLCCYWFEKARDQIEQGRCRRAGLLATQGIRGGASREILKRIKQTGDIYFAESDRDWILDGATVHVSMVGFDAGDESARVLDGQPAERINSDLSASAADVTTSRRLVANLDIAFMGDTKGGAFDINEQQALAFLRSPNPHGRPNSDVVVPWINGLDVTRRRRDVWIIDFGVNLALEESSKYEQPFEFVRAKVHPERQKNKRQAYRDRWWIHVEARPAMRRSLDARPRFLVTTTVSKHRLFVWMESPILPDHQLIAFARSDDDFLGILHSRPHEVWARSRGTQVRERESGFRYTPTTCFETFPFPESTASQRAAIAEAARRLDELRTGWLNPPEWTREVVLEFPGSVDGPWARHVVDPDGRGIGTVRYPIRRPRGGDIAKDLARRTLTNLYNAPPTWLTQAHRRLDEAVAAAYGWSPDLPDADLLARLLALNLAREPAGRAAAEPSEEDTPAESEAV